MLAVYVQGNAHGADVQKVTRVCFHIRNDVVAAQLEHDITVCRQCLLVGVAENGHVSCVLLRPLAIFGNVAISGFGVTKQSNFVAYEFPTICEDCRVMTTNHLQFCKYPVASLNRFACHS